MERPQPLAGIKILDLTWVIAGPLATKCLGDYGADVIKVESKVKLCNHRTLVPFAGGIRSPDRALTFSVYNTSKQGITLNLHHPEGKNIFKRLVNWADIVIENFSAGTMEGWGLGFSELKKVKPDIIMLSASIQGQTGPRAAQSGLGTIMQALGYTIMGGWPDRGPVQPSVPVTDYISAWYIVGLVLSALRYRNWTGNGIYIDLAQTEAGVAMLTEMLLDYEVNNHIWNRAGNRSPYAAPHGVYRCRGNDKWCAITVFSGDEWDSFCRVIGRPVWIGDDRFRGVLARKKNEDELDRLVETWTVSFTPQEVMTTMQENGVPAGAVLDCRDINEDPQLRHRQHFRMVDHPVIGLHSNSDLGFRLSAAEPQFKSAPILGQDNAYVYTEQLGIPTEEFVALLEEKRGPLY